jgi:hypothetical protein
MVNKSKTTPSKKIKAPEHSLPGTFNLNLITIISAVAPMCFLNEYTWPNVVQGNGKLPANDKIVSQ